MEKEAIQAFKDRLLYADIPQLMREGSKDFTAPDIYPLDGQGNRVVPTSAIIDFFLSSLPDSQVINSRIYLRNLHRLFTVFAEDIDGFSFEADSRIPEQEIHDADNQKTIECLTKNLIISFFDNIQTDTGQIDRELLDKKLEKLIKISNTGRDYRTLVENTLKLLVTGLKTEQSWRECIRAIRDARLICKLVGDRLPRIDPDELEPFFLQARNEIAQNNILIGKICYTKNQLFTNQKNAKSYIKVARKLDASNWKILEKIDAFIGDIFDMTKILNIKLKRILGDQEPLLYQNLATLFFGFKKSGSLSVFASIQENYAVACMTMNRLYAFKNICTICRSFKTHPQYRPLYLEIYRLYFKELKNAMDHTTAFPESEEIQQVAHCLFEWEQLIYHMGSDAEQFKNEEIAIQKKYLEMLRTVPQEHLKTVMAFIPMIKAISPDPQHELTETIRSTLLIACFDALMMLHPDPGKMKNFKKSIQKILTNYAEHFSPRRFFYQNFFETCVGIIGSPTSEIFNNMTQTHMVLAREMAALFADPKATGTFLQESHRQYAAKVLERFKE